MFKMFKKVEKKEMLKVVVRNIDTDEVEEIITDKAGLSGIVMNGYDIISTETMNED